MGTNVYIRSQEYVCHYGDMYTLIDGLCPGEGSPSWGSPRLFGKPHASVLRPFMEWVECINTLRPRQDGRHFRDDNFKCIFLNETV